MSKRYGGEFSPSSRSTSSETRETVSAERLEVPSFKGRTPQRHGAKINILFVLPLLALLGAFFQPVTAMAADLSGIAALCWAPG
jgi:hypothetical protein